MHCALSERLDAVPMSLGILAHQPQVTVAVYIFSFPIPHR